MTISRYAASLRFKRSVRGFSRSWNRILGGMHSLVAVFLRTLGAAWPLALAGLLALPAERCCHGEEIGRAAPSLQVTNWLRGEPVDLKRAGPNRVHVILFWETWCDSCMASLPEVVDVQERLRPRGVEFVGICPESPEAVKAFLANSELGPKLNFALASDESRKTFESYMTAFGQSQVPRAFVVDRRGTLVWYGHPLAGLEYALQQIVADKFDLAAAKKMLGAEQLQADYFRRAATNSEVAEAQKLGRKIVSDGAGNPWLLNNFAWRILQDSRLEKRDVALAIEASRTACAATEWRRPTFLDTHALALFSNGEVSGAIRMQKQALTLCTNEVLRGRLEQSLKTFEAGRTNNAGR